MFTVRRVASHKVVWFFALWRVVLIVVAMVAVKYLPFRTDFEFTQLSYHAPAVASELPQLLTAWANFDGVYYLRNASTDLLAEPRYLPIYPILISIVSGAGWKGMGQNHVVAGLIVSHLSLAVAIYYLHKLFQVSHSSNTASWAVLLLLSFPTAFFLVSVYSESLFLCLAVLAFWLAKKKRWWGSFALAAVASVTRLPGIFLIVPLAYEWWSSQTPAGKIQPMMKKLASLGMYFSLAVLPLLVLMLVQELRFGDALKFVHSHGELANGRSTTGLVFPVVTVWRYLKILVSLNPRLLEWWVAFVELGSFAGFLAGILWMWQKKLSISYHLYVLSLLFLPVFSGTFSGLPRYLLLAFPLFFAVAQSPRAVKLAIVIGGFFLQAIFCALFLRGYFIA